MISGKKITFFVTVDWYFRLHWMQLAIAVQKAGYQVSVITQESGEGDLIRASGLKLLPINLSRGGSNPFTDLNTLAELRKILKSERPDILHNIAQKPTIYGTLVGRALGIPVIVNTMAGMGWVFSSDAWRAAVIKPLLAGAYRLLFHHRSTHLVVQNPDDAQLLAHHTGLPLEKIAVIRGVGVNLQHYRPQPEPVGPIVVTLASRLVWDKGVAEFVEAARLLQQRGCSAQLHLVGKPDDDNPAAIPLATLQQWHQEGIVTWHGFRDDMANVLAESHIIALPSYREGLPTILIEAAAAGKPMIATDVPGCREVVKDGVNGYLVPIKNVEVLANAIKKLIDSPQLRYKMGMAGRELAEHTFSIEIIVCKHLAIYRSCLLG
ncbi:MAG: glycosyltransferase family 4 protein [Gammaproteobacteria bacterium]|nr:glycosyltransferase family 4 protein [Gammaproteobacteria bacterium]